MSELKIFRDPVTHDLKIYPEFFSAVCTGVKRAELRKNDRDYRVGDTLHLMETERGCCSPTGEFINATITHIADVSEWLPGYVLLSIEMEGMALRERAEPVAWMLTDNEFGHSVATKAGFTLNFYRSKGWGVTPLYTAPPAPVVAPDERKAFESWYLERMKENAAWAKDYTLDEVVRLRGDDGEYRAYGFTSGCWAGWNARADMLTSKEAK